MKINTTDIMQRGQKAYSEVNPGGIVKSLQKLIEINDLMNQIQKVEI